MRSGQVILFLLLPLAVLAGYGFQSNPPKGQEYKLKAAFLYRFMDYIDLNPPDQHPVSITVLGESPILDPLIEISHQKRSIGPEVVIHQASSVNEIGPSQIIFVSRNYKFTIDAVTAKFSDRPVLIVSEQKGELDKGSHINFLVADNKLKFEVNLRTASRSGIKIGSQLLQHALVIKR